jgi:predicted nucleic acid-binding protein
MKKPDLILIDTCMWVSFFNRSQSVIKHTIDDLLDKVRAWLSGLQYLEVRREDWESAAGLCREIARRGHRIPLSDLVLAAVAFRFDCSIYRDDPHFDLFSKLKRYSPKAP